MDNVITALEQTNHVREVAVHRLEGWQLEKVLAPMQVSFSELTGLFLSSDFGSRPIPDSFLGGSAPRLRTLLLQGIPFHF